MSLVRFAPRADSVQSCEAAAITAAPFRKVA
jgi:hypothetical protein